MGTLLEEWLKDARLIVRPIITLPVKHHWEDIADINLLCRSTLRVLTIAEGLGLQTVAMPRPGCGNGHLSWEDVKREIVVPLTGSATEFIVCHK